MENKLPIGYYLKMADNLLTEGIHNIHQETGITRTDWQILNSINENNNLDVKSITKLLSVFADNATIAAAITNLHERGIILLGNKLSLTERGKSLYENCLQKQKQFRQIAMQNISEEEYENTLACLEKIIENLSPKISN